MISELSIRFKNIRGDCKKGFPVISGVKYHEDGVRNFLAGHKTS